MPEDTRTLLAEYLREPRSIRRAVNRDLARRYPIPPRQPSNGEIAELVHARHPMPVRPPSTRSGQMRTNHKRNQRAAFWATHHRTVRIAVSGEMEPYFREHLGLLGDHARVDGRTPSQEGFGGWIDLDVHIPGAPTDAVRAHPVYISVLGQDVRLRPVLLSVEWERADGSRFETPDLPALV